MVQEFRYKLEKGSKKHRCPACHKKRFVRYVDTQTGKYLPDTYGRCDRATNCVHDLNPYTDGYAKIIRDNEQSDFKGNWKPPEAFKKPKELKKPKPVFMPVEVLSRTRAGYEQNSFIQNLLTNVAFPFEPIAVEKVISLYHLGTVQNGYRKGAVTFPFIDKDKNVRAIQVKKFDKDNHTTGTDFLHSIIDKHHIRKNKPLPKWLQDYNTNETKVSCLFGEHLLTKYPYNPIALVEAPKTAVYGTLYFGLPERPTDLLWLAVYNLSSLNLDKCKALAGRNVNLFPDLSKDGKAFNLWSKKAIKIESQLEGIKFTVSDLLEQLAPDNDRTDGKDLADYLIKQDWRLYRKQTPDAKPQPKFIEKAESVKSVKSVAVENNYTFDEAKPEKVEKLTFEDFELFIEQPESWRREIQELEKFFKTASLYPQTVKLNHYTTITNVTRFVESHLATIKNYNDQIIFIPYLERLKRLKENLNNQVFSEKN
jgi:hypothetical protein